MHAFAEPEQQVNARIDLAVTKHWKEHGSRKAVASGERRVYSVEPTPVFVGTHAGRHASDAINCSTSADWQVCAH